MKVFETISELTVPTASSWQTINLSSYFGTQDSPVGLLLMVTNKSTSAYYTAGARCYGSSETYTWRMHYGERMFLPVGLSSDKKIDLYSSNLTNLDFHLVAFFEDHEAYFPVTRHAATKTGSTTANWSDIDPSSIIQGGDVPRGYLGILCAVATWNYARYTGARPNGSTDTGIQNVLFPGAASFFVATNDELIEVCNYSPFGTPANITVLTAGYLKQSSKLLSVINAETIQSLTSSDSWANVPDTKTLGGVPAMDFLSAFSLGGTTDDPLPVRIALAASSSDTPLATPTAPGDYAWSIYGGALTGLSPFPLLRSRATGRTQSAYLNDFDADTVTANLIAYLAWSKSSGVAAFMLGELF
jgi:hypothetical protein